MERPSLRPVGISDFIEWRDGKLLELSPKFQRRRIWPPKAKAFLIDTIVRGLPVPKLYMRQHLDPSKKIKREVVDGQQRVASVLEYYDGAFALARDHDLYPGAKFSGLPQSAQDEFLKYEFSVDVLVDAQDSDVLDIFARINSYSVPLNAQEKRNAAWFGSFKHTVYTLGLEHLEFWKKNRILTDQAVARMREAELTSELLVAMASGLQDKKKSLDTYYRRWDDRFPYRTKAVARFRDVIDLLDWALAETLPHSRFRKPALFYSLFLVVYELRYGPMNNFSGRQQAVSEETREQLVQAVKKLGDVLAKGDRAPTKYRAFVQACARQTDNLTPRRIRHRTLLSEVTSG